MSEIEAAITIIRLAAIAVITRALLLFSERELVLPGEAHRGLRYAPLAALAAVVVPEVVMSQGHLIATWQDTRVFACSRVRGGNGHGLLFLAARNIRQHRQRHAGDAEGRAGLVTVHAAVAVGMPGRLPRIHRLPPTPPDPP